MEQNFSDLSEKFMGANSALMDSAMKVGAAVMKTQGDVVQQQFRLVEKWVEAGNRHLELIRDARDPADYFTKAAEIGTEFTQEVTSIMRQTMELQMEAGGSIAGVMRDEFTNGLANAVR